MLQIYLGIANIHTETRILTLDTGIAFSTRDSNS